LTSWGCTLSGFYQDDLLNYGVGSNPKKVQYNDVFTQHAKLSKGRGKFIKAEQIMNRANVILGTDEQK
jgi:hypothetical protein